jgi:FkbM family methyltransferase
MLENILKKYREDISGVIQVGAHIGQQVDLFLQLENIVIHLFEPQKDPLEVLKKYKKYSNINIHEFGLGNTNEKLKLYKSDNKKGVSSSILKPKLHTKYFPEVKFNNYELIEVKKFSSLEDVSGNFLMIDVQGYELEVLKGFEDKIQNLDFIFTEISIKEFYENNILVKDLDKFLIEKGFVRTSTFLYSNIPMGDALYVNKKRLGQFITTLCILKSNFQITNIYRFFNFFSNKNKVIYIFKKYLKELIK